MTFKEIMSGLKNQKIALYIDSEQDFDELMYLAQKYPEDDIVDMYVGKGLFSDYVKEHYIKFSHHVYFYGSLDFIGSVNDLDAYQFNYPVVSWHDVIETEKEKELDEVEYFHVLMN